MENGLIGFGTVWFYAVVGWLAGTILHLFSYYLPLLLKHRWLKISSAYLGLAVSDHRPVISSFWSLQLICSDCVRQTKLVSPPLLGWLINKGRCHQCESRLKQSYPMIEAITMLITVCAYYRFPQQAMLWASLIFCYYLIALAVIDFYTQLLPDELTLSLLWLGLIINLNSTFVDLSTAVIGAIGGYLFFWGLFWLVKIVTAKEGLGYGDFKLLAAIGTWQGWFNLPMIIFTGTILALFVTMLQIPFKGKGVISQPLPLGGYLAIAAILIMF